MRVGGEVIGEFAGIESRRHDNKFNFVLILAVDNILEGHEGEVHFETALMDLVKNDVCEGDAAFEQQLLDQDAVGHVDDRTILFAEGLHPHVVPHLGSQLAVQLLRDSDSQRCGSHSSRLANGNLRGW